MKIELKVEQNNENGTDYYSPEWTLGSCYGPKLTISYDENELYYDICCLLPGRYTLTCINKKSEFGWGNTKFEINGKRYCDDFVGFKAMRTIIVEGNE